MLSPDRRGTLLNTVVWIGAVAAMAGLTVWKFDLLPLGIGTAATGRVVPTDGTVAGADDFPAAPIAVAHGAPVAQPLPEPERAAPRPLPPPAQMGALRLEASFTPDDRPQPPAWPPTPPDLAPAGGEPKRHGGWDSEPIASAAPAGTAFGSAGTFPVAERPATARRPTAPRQPELLTTTLDPALRPVGGTSPTSTAPADASPVNTRLAAAADPRIATADAFLAAGDVLAAHKELSKIYWDAPALRADIQERIDGTARKIYFDPQPHYMPAYEVQPGDRLAVIARRYSVPWEYLAAINAVDPQRIQAGQRLKVIKGPFAAVVGLDDYSLIVHAHGYYVRRFDVGVGKDASTPIGTFKVCLKEADPKYWGPNGNVMERDDPNNPLGERWLGLDDGDGRPTSYGLHGTIDSSSIGRADSRGCLRLRNDDVAQLYDLLSVGSEVVIGK